MSSALKEGYEKQVFRNMRKISVFLSLLTFLFFIFFIFIFLRLASFKAHRTVDVVSTSHISNSTRIFHP